MNPLENDPETDYCVPVALDLSGTRFRAEVDWVDIEIETATPTNHRGVRSRTGQAYAEPLNPQLSGAATKFRIRVQNPSWPEIRESLAGYELITPPRVVGIEVALDVYSDGASKAQLVQLLADMAWQASAFGRAEEQAVGSPNIRLAGAGKNSVAPLGTLRDLRKRLESQTLYIGDQRATIRRGVSPEAWRFYFKTTDAKKDLPEELHRARMEVTLTGEGLFSNDLKDWEEFGFERLADKFRFRTVADKVNPLIQGALLHFPLTSFAPKRRRSGGGIQRHRSWTKANTPLNRRMFDAFRGLTKKMSRQRAPRRLTNRKLPAQIAERQTT